MIKTLNPYANTAKTAEIMSRYRPIAPRPETGTASAAAPPNSPGTSVKIRQSPYLRNLWPQLQARPTRTRKRAGRSTPPASLKRQRTLSALSPPPCHVAFVEPKLVTLPLMPPSSTAEIDLNRAAAEEEHLPAVIAPQPVRPVGSTICVRGISEERARAVPSRRPEEVEAEVEAEELPAVISDSKNKVRMANSAYKELVGQPECPWLDSINVPTKRIGGEVVLRLSDSASRLPASSPGFSCWVTIHWGSASNRSSVNAFCDVIRLACDSKDYLFSWRFHTRDPPTSHINV